MTKKLDVSFKLNLDTKEVDDFLVDFFVKTPILEGAIHLHFIGRAMVVKFLLASILWFFISVSRY